MFFYAGKQEVILVMPDLTLPFLSIPNPFGKRGKLPL
jgi:hypothetical protein